MDELIYCQKKIPKKQWPYGIRSSAATGCGWIATYNALRLLGYYASPEKLIRYYLRQLPLIHGTLGTAVWGPALCFRQWGFSVEITAKRQEFDRKLREGAVGILFYYWHRGWKIGAHFVAVTFTEQGYVGYNTYANSTGPDCYGNSLDGFIRRRKYFAPVLTIIRKKK